MDNISEVSFMLSFVFVLGRLLGFLKVGVYLMRIFSRISRTCHASESMKVNMMLKVQTFSTRMERESRWHYGIAVDPGFLGNVTQWRDSANRQLL